MTDSAPLVSVVVPTYNRASLLPATLDAILAQTFKDFELIVVDDGSTDATADLLRARCAGDPRTRVVSRENGGIARAKNSGLEAARGRYVAFCDHDDLWLPHKLSRQVEALEGDPAAGLCYTRYGLFGEDGRVFKERPRRGYSGDIFLPMLRKVFVLTSSAVARRTVIDRVGGFDPALALADDLDFHLRVAHAAPALYLDERLVLYRVYQGNASRTRSAPRRYTEEILEVYRRWQGRADLTPEAAGVVRRRVAKYHYNLARHAAQAGDHRLAGRHARRAAALCPSNVRFLAGWFSSALPHPEGRR
ncbi:MAG: glycosyltransferase [Planctomycetes bacterium]|nr:glycosyltransferase [Planctomycetota bacterium]